MNNPYAAPVTTKRSQGGPSGGPAGQRRLYPDMNDQSFDSMQTSSRDNYYHGATGSATMQSIGGAAGGAMGPGGKAQMMNQGYTGSMYPDPQA